MGIKNFFWYKNRWVSASPEFNTMVANKIKLYVKDLIEAPDPDTVIPPTIDEPQNVIDNPEPFLLKWEEFSYESATKAQIQQRINNNRYPCLEACQKLFDHLPQDIILTYEELGRPHQRNIQSCMKYDFIEKAGRNKYILHYPRKGEEEE